MQKAYEGKEPYIFISYAHKDQDEVMQYIDGLQSRGFRVWYDGGIQYGTEWPDNIAKHLRKCACVISFVSENYVDSDNCRRELTFSQDLKIDHLSVYLQDLQPEDLPDGIRLQLGLSQGMFRGNFESETAFLDELVRAPMMQECQGKADLAESSVESEPVGRKSILNWLCEWIYRRVSGSEREKKEHWTRVSKALVWVVVLIEIAYIPISEGVLIGFLNRGHGHDYSFLFRLSLAMIGVHLFLAWSNLSVYVVVRKLVSLAGVDEKPLRDARFYMRLSVLASSILAIVMQMDIFSEIWQMGVFAFFPSTVAVVMVALVVHIYSAMAAALFYMLLREKKR